MQRKLSLLVFALLLLFVFGGTSAVAAADPTNNTINGTITIKEYNAVSNLANATVTVNASGKVLGTTKTDANGYYSINFFSNLTKFNVTASYVGCNNTNQTVTLNTNNSGTANIQLTPNVIWWTGNMGASTKVYIKHYGGYYSAGQLQVTMDGIHYYYAYCIDIYTGIGANDKLLVNGPLPGTRGDLPDGIDWAKVNYIVSHFDPSKNTTTDAKNIEGAAIQCAIWYFTSAPYGVFPVNNPSYTGYYQFMTYDDRYNSSLPSPYDGRTEKNYGTWLNPNYNKVEERTWQIINAALAMQYPDTVELTPDTTKVENGGTLNLTAIVKDQNGNPLNNMTVNFTSTSGTFNATSAVTDALGMVRVSISGLTPNITNLITASVYGQYGTLLYDNPLDPKQNLVAANLLPFTISDTSYVTCEAKANVSLSQTVNSPVNVGDTVTYVVTAYNKGTNRATNIVISDIMPSALANVTVTPSVGTYNSTTGLWIIPSLNNGASATLTITGQATAGMAGLNTTNTATRISQDQYNNESNTTSATVYTKKADVTLSQTVNGASSGSVTVNVGDKLTYLITATNNGPDTATMINIRDLVPNGLTGVTITPSVGNYNSTTGVWTIPSLVSGVSATLNITGTVGPSMAGNNTTNTATVISQVEYDPTVPSSTSIPAYTKKANVVLSQTVNSPVNVGDTVKYVVTALNNGPDTATNILIHDLIPALAGVVVTPSVGTYNSTSGVWIIPSLASGVSATLNITGTATAAMAGTNTTNTATQTGQTEYNEAYTTANAATYTKLASVSVTNTASSGSLNVGDTGYFTVTVTNNGPDTVTNINITDRINGWIPDHATVTAGTYNPVTGVWTIPSLAPGASATWTFSAVVPSYVAGTNVTNVVTEVQSEYPLSVDVANATIYVKKANVVLSQTVNSPVNVGNTVSYIVTALNNGPDAATNINILDVIPAGLAGVVVTPSVGTYNSTSGVWSIPSLASGVSATLNITGTATAAMAGNNTTNTATQIGQTEYSDEYTNASATVYTKKADVVLSQTGGYYKNNVTFIVTATNNGPDAATEINIRDMIPNGLTNVIVTPSVGTYNAGTGIWYIPSLANGTSATLNITGTANPVTIINNTANKTNQIEYDPTTPDISKYSIYVPSVNMYVVLRPWYYDTKTGTYQTTSDCGNTIVYSVNVRNYGTDDATGVVVKFVLGDGYYFTGASTESVDAASEGNFTYDPVTRTVTWYIGFMPKSGMSYLKVSARVIGTSSTSNLTTTASVVGVDQYDATTVYAKTANYTISTPVCADIQVNQNQTTFTGADGYNYVTYTITVKNNGPDNATGVKITDKLPSGLVYAGNMLSTDGGVTWITNSTLYNSSSGVWTIGDFSVDDPVKILTITARVTATTGIIRNSASRSAINERDYNYDNNAQTCALVLSGTYTPTTNMYVILRPWYYDTLNNTYQTTSDCGNTIVYSVNVRNYGTDDATGVVVKFVLGDGYYFTGASTESVDAASEGNFTYDPVTRTVTWYIGFMPKSGMSYLKVSARVIGTSSTSNLTTTASVVGVDQYDATTVYAKTANYTISTPVCADIQVNQNQTTFTGADGYNYVTYTITVKNNGPDNATGVQVTDKLPSGLVYAGNMLSTDGGVTWSINDTVYNSTSGVWNIGNVSANGQQLILKITARIIGTGIIRNTASRSAINERDYNYDNNAQTCVIG